MNKSADQAAKKEDMAPRNGDPMDNQNKSNPEEADLQEMVAVNNSLDQITQALDSFEQRTDDIIEQLKVLLHSNREIRQQMAMEQETTLVAALSEALVTEPNAKDSAGSENNDKSNSSDNNE